MANQKSKKKLVKLILIFYLTQHSQNIISTHNQNKKLWDILHFYLILSLQNPVCVFYIYSTTQFELATFQSAYSSRANLRLAATIQKSSLTYSKFAISKWWLILSSSYPQFQDHLYNQNTSKKVFTSTPASVHT